MIVLEEQRPGDETQKRETEKKRADEAFDLIRELQEARACIQGGGVLRDEIRNMWRRQVSKDRVSHEQGSGFSPESSGKTLKGFKQERGI